jgi:hypothetical protein
LIARDLGYLETQVAKNLENMVAETGKMLNGLINSLRENPALRSSRNANAN